MKKRGFGNGMWNGSGGKPNEGEAIDEAAIREVQEELGVKVLTLQKRGEISFFLEKENSSVLMHVFFATDWQKEPVESEEMKPKWFKINDVPYERMWEADSEWLPIVFSGKKIRARYSYSHEGGKVLTRKIEEFQSF